MCITWTRGMKVASVIVLACALAACSMFSSKDVRYQPAELTQYPAAVTTRINWSSSIGSGGGYGFIPAVVGDAVYAATPDGQVAKFNLASGQASWRSSAGMKLSAGAGSDARTTAVAGPDGTVIAFDDQGQEKWRARATSEVNIPPAVGFGQVIVRSGDYRIQAFDADSGELRWSVQRPGPALALKSAMQMRLIDGLLITGMPNGRLMAIDVNDGVVQWEGTVAVSQGATDLDRISDVVGAPQIQGPLLCGVTYQGRMACFDLSQGAAMRWSQPFSSHSGMTTDNNAAYAADRRSVVHAFSLDDGDPLWKQDALRNRRLSTPAVVPEGVVVGDLEGYVHVLDRHTGELLGRIHIGGKAIVSSLIATPRGVLVQTAKGDLVLVGLH